MPGMNGLELARAIRSIPAIANTQLVMLSSLDYDTTSNAEEIRNIATCLTKPVRQAEPA